MGDVDNVFESMLNEAWHVMVDTHGGGMYPQMYNAHQKIMKFRAMVQKPLDTSGLSVEQQTATQVFYALERMVIIFLTGQWTDLMRTQFNMTQFREGGWEIAGSIVNTAMNFLDFASIEDPLDVATDYIQGLESCELIPFDVAEALTVLLATAQIGRDAGKAQAAIENYKAESAELRAVEEIMQEEKMGQRIIQGVEQHFPEETKELKSAWSSLKQMWSEIKAAPQRWLKSGEELVEGAAQNIEHLVTEFEETKEVAAAAKAVGNIAEETAQGVVQLEKNVASDFKTIKGLAGHAFKSGKKASMILAKRMARGFSFFTPYRTVYMYQNRVKQGHDYEPHEVHNFKFM